MELETAPVIHKSHGAGPHVGPARMVPVRCGRTRWLVRDDLAFELLDGDRPSGLPLELWLARGVAEVVKAGPHRAVHRLSLAAGEFYLKHYRIPGLRAALQNVVRPCKALLEWTAARRVAACGIPTCEPVAVGRTYAGWRVVDNYLVTRGIADVEPLHDFVLEVLPRLSALRQTRIRQQIAAGLGRVAGRLHRGRLAHHDFHAGNVLVRVDDEDRVRLWLIDLHAVSRRFRLSERERRGNLASLGHFFTAWSTRSDRFRFFRAYWRELRNVTAGDELPGGGAFASAARETDLFCRRASERAFRRDDLKWRRRNRRVRIIDGPRGQARGLADLGQASLRRVCQRPDELFAADRVRRWIRREPGARVAIVAFDCGGAVRTCRATSVRRHRVGRWLGWFQDSTARQGWEMGHALLRRRIPAVKPLLLVESSSGKDPEGFLLVEEPPGAVSLQEFMGPDTGCSGSDAGAWMRRVLTSRLAGLIRGLHRAGFAYANLTADRLLVSLDRGCVALWCAAPEDIRQRGRVSRKHRLDNLAQLENSIDHNHPNVTRASRVRFLRQYVEPASADEWKSWCRAIAERVERLTAASSGSSRRLAGTGGAGRDS